MSALAFLFAVTLQVDSITVPVDSTEPAFRAPANALIIPNDIAPAVQPYLACLYGARGIQVRGMDGSAQPATIPVGTDCAPHRARASAHADRLLRNRGRGTTGERRAYIESVLAALDRSVPRGGGGAPPDRLVEAADLGKPEDPLRAIDIPYQIMPAYLSYTRCVGERLRASQGFASAEPNSLRAAHDEAVAGCRDERATQLGRALDLLTDYRAYGGDRERARAAARTAFDRFDRDYLIESQTGSSPQPLGAVRQRQSVSLPGEIASLLAPYLICMLEDRAERLLGVSTGPAARAAVERLKNDCRSARDAAERASREHLRSGRLPASRQDAIVAAGLAAIDQSRENIVEHLDGVNARRAAVREP